MSEQPVTLLPYYRGWDNYQEQLIQAISPLTSEQLAIRSATHLRSIGENATHIIGARAGWTYFVLGQGDETLSDLARWDEPGQPARSAEELVNGLTITWRVLEETLAHWTGADMAEIVHDTDEHGQDQSYTRQWVIWHLIEHDLHHGGEISFVLGMYGLTGISI